MKTCIDCGLDFKRTIKGRCEPCHYQEQKKDTEWLAKRQARSRKWARDNKEGATKNRRASRYGLTRYDIDNMLFNQMGECAIDGCKRDATDVDHDHKTTVVRKLLCNPCNLALGLVNDSIDRLKGLIDYLS